MNELKKKAIDKLYEHFPSITSEQILLMTLGGSHLHGTNDETSDYDFRCVLFLDEKYHFGLEDFKHKKIIGGTNNINQKDDLDIEVFHLNYFIKKLFEGEFIPFEMLYSPTLSETKLIQPLLDKRELFLSLKVPKKYYGFIQKNINSAFIDIDKAVKRSFRPDKIQRLEEYGYETKFAMKAILGLKICNELLECGDYILDRRNIDQQELMDIKNGKYSKQYVQEWIEELDSKQKVLMKETKLPDSPNYKEINNFMISYQKSLFQELGIF